MDARSALATATAAGTVTEAIKAEVLRTLALSGNADETATKQEMLYQAQAALAALPADATAAMTLAEREKVLAAAKAWKMELEEADAAHSMVMMAQGEVDAAQSAVDTTVAMMERGTQIATNVKEANNLAAAVRGASGARSGSDTATGFDRTQSGDTDGYGVNITRLGPLSSLTFTLVDGADDNDADASELTALKSKYVTEYKDGKAVETDVPSPQSISGWHDRQIGGANPLSSPMAAKDERSARASSRGGVREGSVEQSRDPMDKNRIRHLSGRTSGQVTAKSVAIKGRPPRASTSDRRSPGPWLRIPSILTVGIAVRPPGGIKYRRYSGEGGSAWRCVR